MGINLVVFDRLVTGGIFWETLCVAEALRDFAAEAKNLLIVSQSTMCSLCLRHSEEFQRPVFVILLDIGLGESRLQCVFDTFAEVCLRR